MLQIESQRSTPSHGNETNVKRHVNAVGRAPLQGKTDMTVRRWSIWCENDEAESGVYVKARLDTRVFMVQHTPIPCSHCPPMKDAFVVKARRGDGGLMGDYWNLKALPISFMCFR